MLLFHKQIKSRLLWKTLHKPYTHFTIPLQCDCLSNLMQPSNQLADISDMTVYSEVKFAYKNIKETQKIPSASDTVVIAISEKWTSYLLKSRWCFLSSWCMATFAYLVACTLPSEIRDEIEKLTARWNRKDGNKNKKYIDC